MKNLSIKIPRKNQIWVGQNPIPDKPKYYFLVTDVATKKEKEDYKMYDDEWNEAPVGTKFVYGVNTKKDFVATHRGKLEKFLDNYTFYRNCPPCPCPYCERHHLPPVLIGD